MKNTPWNVIQQLEADNSRLAKEAIIEREIKAGNGELMAGMRMALDNFETFGVKQIPEKTQAGGAGLSWGNFNTVAQQLINRQLTGNAARDAVNQLMNQATQEQWNGWLRRILIKDLRCGVTETTVNKIAKRCKTPLYEIPVFECQLAFDSNNHQGKVTGVKQLERKLDGVRCITIVYPDGRVNMFTRNGKELTNFPHIVKQMQSMARHMEHAWVFDGEVMSASFQDLMKQVHRKSNVQSADAVLYLFDNLSLEDFRAGGSQVPQRVRSQVLSTWYAEFELMLPNVRILQSEVVDLSTEQGRTRFAAFNNQAIADGFEGVMLKDLNAGYECKRSTAWLKLKPVITVDLTVIGVEEGTGKNAGRLGALVCSGDFDGKTICVNTGTGFTDTDRDQIWMMRNQVIGQVVEVKADAVTQNQDGSFSMRFPRFERWRGFNTGEKI
jgi:DNA ligase-1